MRKSHDIVVRSPGQGSGVRSQETGGRGQRRKPRVSPSPESRIPNSVPGAGPFFAKRTSECSARMPCHTTSKRKKYQSPAAVSCPAFRPGFSLFEVLIALAIFVTSAAVIGQLISSGVRAAVRSRLETQAVLRCESKMAEVVSGYAMLQSVTGTPFTDDSSWTWSTSIEAGPQPDLYLVSVKVSHPSTGQLDDLSFTLSRLVRDPTATTEMMKEKQATQQSSQSSSTSSTSGGSSGATGGSR
jgi:general secretion pathway protein I